MHFSIAAITLLFAGAMAAPKALEPRYDGCPSNSPYPMGSPGDYWYIVCCPYVLSDSGCCNREPQTPRSYGGIIPACPGASA